MRHDARVGDAAFPSKDATPSDVLLVLEDIDIVFEEDRGFHLAILKLMESSKRPIILTCTRKNFLLTKKWLMHAASKCAGFSIFC